MFVMVWPAVVGKPTDRAESHCAPRRIGFEELRAEDADLANVRDRRAELRGGGAGVAEREEAHAATGAAEPDLGAISTGHTARVAAAYAVHDQGRGIHQAVCANAADDARHGRAGRGRKISGRERRVVAREQQETPVDGARDEAFGEVAVPLASRRRLLPLTVSGMASERTNEPLVVYSSTNTGRPRC